MELYKEYTGIEFNEFIKGKILVKLTNKKGEHKKYKFKTGFNVDTIKFNPTGQCKAGGIYFIFIEEINKWLNYGVGKMSKIGKMTKK